MKYKLYTDEYGNPALVIDDETISVHLSGKDYVEITQTQAKEIFPDNIRL